MKKIATINPRKARITPAKAKSRTMMSTMTPQAKQPDRKPQRQFRAVAWERSTYVIESSLNGTDWVQAVAGLDASEVQKKFDEFTAHGKKIVSTSDFKYKPSR